MHTRDLGTIALGIAAFVVSGIFPTSAPALVPVGAWLVGLAMKRPSDRKKAPPPPAAALSLVVGLGLCLYGSPALASADDPVTGQCLSKAADGSCDVSYHASAVVPSVAVRLSDGKVLGGVDALALGACYGVTWKPAQLYAAGADVCLVGRASNTVTNQIGGALNLRLSRLSAGFAVIKGDGVPVAWLLFFAPTVPLW
jgi:hypothetical protein